MRVILLGLLVALLGTPALASDAAMAKLAADYDAYLLAEDPFTAGREGDRAALSRLPDFTPAADRRRAERLRALQSRLQAIPTDSLTPDMRLNRDVMAWRLESALRAQRFDPARLAFTSDTSFESTLGYVAATTPIRTEADARAWLDRLAAAPDWYRAHIENARRGARSGFTQPARTAEIVLKQARAAVDGPTDRDPLLRPLAELPAAIPAPRQVALRSEAQALIRERIAPVRREFVTFLKREYLPTARRGLGVRTATAGEDYYRFLVADFTTTDMTPDEVHALGRSEVARIRAEMERTMQEAGHQGDLKSFLAALRKDPRFHAASREDLLEKASEIAKRIDDRLPSMFATLPRLPYGVRPVPQEIEVGYTTGRYFSGSPKLGVAGGYMVNTYALDQRPLYELPALTAHEAVPGHHLQIALAQELEGLPLFRREADVTAFTEGWGLYSEKVAGEMGIYRTPHERFGQLSYEMWRACRLVADTGLHWLGWSLEQAKACFLENTALAPLNIEVEVERYISWPGQALAYKVGELTFLRLREKARTALGERFDIRRFHDAVLLAGPLPLALLERRVEMWIESERRRV